VQVNTLRRFTSLASSVSPSVEQHLRRHEGVLEIDSKNLPPVGRICFAMDGIVRKIFDWMPTQWTNNARPLHWAFTSDRNPAAFATVIRDASSPYDLVILTQGMFGAAEGLFNRMLADPQNFTSIGNPAREFRGVAPVVGTDFLPR
jgi:hypothetical protein